MKGLTKILLDFDLAFDYVLQDLEGCNTLSSKLIENINFKEGYFYTLVPSDYTPSVLYQFKCGGLLPQNPIKRYTIGSKFSTYSVIPTIQEELAHYLNNLLNINPLLTCIFDDYITKAEEVEEFADAGIVFTYENEVYYAVDNKWSESTLESCLEASNQIWHSLAILTTEKLQKTNKILTLEELKDICTKVQIIIVGAYDGEGYVFWENMQNANSSDTGIRYCAEVEKLHANCRRSPLIGPHWDYKGVKFPKGARLYI